MRILGLVLGVLAAPALAQDFTCEPLEPLRPIMPGEFTVSVTEDSIVVSDGVRAKTSELVQKGPFISLYSNSIAADVIALRGDGKDVRAPREPFPFARATIYFVFPQLDELVSFSSTCSR